MKTRDRHSEQRNKTNRADQTHGSLRYIYCTRVHTGFKLHNSQTFPNLKDQTPAQ